MAESRRPALFASLAEAIAAIHQASEPVMLIRFEVKPADDLVLAASAAAAADPEMPGDGEHPDRRRDHDVTADIEINYLRRQLIERGHARQVVSLNGGHLHEVTAARIVIAGDDAIYGFVSLRMRG